MLAARKGRARSDLAQDAVALNRRLIQQDTRT